MSRDGAYGLPPPSDDGADFHSRNGINETGSRHFSGRVSRANTGADSDDSTASKYQNLQRTDSNVLTLFRLGQALQVGRTKRPESGEAQSLHGLRARPSESQGQERQHHPREEAILRHKVRLVLLQALDAPERFC